MKVDVIEMLDPKSISHTFGPNGLYRYNVLRGSHREVSVLIEGDEDDKGAVLLPQGPL